MKKDSAATVSRRGFLRCAALTAGAGAAAGALGCSSVDTSGLSATGADEKEERQLLEETTALNRCRGNCAGWCLLRGTVRDGKLVNCAPTTFDRDAVGMTEGCVRGITNPMRLYADNRVLHPMRQTGERGSGNWEQISWDEALSLVAEKFQEAIDEVGPSAVAFWGGAGNQRDFVNGTKVYSNFQNVATNGALGYERFMRAMGTTVLALGADEASLWVASVHQLPTQNSAESLQYAKTLLVWGSNPAEALRGAWPWMCKARENGAKMVTIDPVYINVAGHSDEWVPIRIGTDTAMLLAMANYIVENDLVDEDYFKNHSVAPLLVKEDGKYLRQSEVGIAVAEGEMDEPMVFDLDADDFVIHTAATNPAITGSRTTPDGVAVRTAWDCTKESIAPFTVEFAAEECGVSEETIVELATMYATEKPAQILVSLGIEHLYNSWRVYAAFGLLGALTGNAGVSGAGYIGAGCGYTASSIYKSPTKLNTDHTVVENERERVMLSGDLLPDVMRDKSWNGKPLDIRCVYIHANDPINNSSGAVEVLEGLLEVPFVVTADSFMTRTAHYSDLVLPVCMSWEMEDLLDRGWMGQKAVEPAGECRCDFDIIYGIAEKMGVANIYAHDNVTDYLRDILDTEENIADGCAYEDYHEKGVLITDYEYVERVTPEAHPIGRTQFYIESLYPHDDNGYQMKPTDYLPLYERPYEAYKDNPKRETYPLFGVFTHDNYHAQSFFSHNPWLDDFRTYEGRPFMRIHEKAAAERGISTGDTVRVFNDRGSVTLAAVVTKGLQEETIWLPHGFFWDEFEDGHVQDLTGRFLDPISTNSAFNDFLCEVEKL